LPEEKSDSNSKADRFHVVNSYEEMEAWNLSFLTSIEESYQYYFPTYLLPGKEHTLGYSFRKHERMTRLFMFTAQDRCLTISC